MGYSCTTAANRTVDKWSDFCFKQNGSSNTFESNGDSYFYEIGRENGDGAITGTIWKVLIDGRCKRSGTFRVNPDGTIARAPKILKEVAGQ